MKMTRMNFRFKGARATFSLTTLAGVSISTIMGCSEVNARKRERSPAVKVRPGGALNSGDTLVKAEEIMYQPVPYAGIAKAFDFNHATNVILKNRGIKLPLERQSTITPDSRFEKGSAMQKGVFGEIINTMHDYSPPVQIHIQKLLSAHCFGDYDTRTGPGCEDARTSNLFAKVILGGRVYEHQLKDRVSWHQFQ